MYSLGISAFYHDSAAALLKDGIPIVALEEERFSRIKHDNAFPRQAARNCLKAAGISIRDIDSITYYEKPLRKFERILEMYVETYPRAITPFIHTLPAWLQTKINAERVIRTELCFDGSIYYTSHHQSHAAGSFFTSSFKEAAILAIDGVGEYETTTLWRGNGNNLEQMAALHFPHSLGLLYSTITAFLGFQVNNDEYKVMGLAAFGNPLYTKEFEQLIALKEDGSFRLDMRCFGFRETYRMWNAHLETLLGQPRKQGAKLEKRHKDIAASLQSVTEKVYFSILTHLHAVTDSENLCVSGGVALNSLANGKILDNTPFKQVHIMGAAGDSGSALGAALATHHSKKQGTNMHRKSLKSLSLGTEYSDSEIEKILTGNRCQYTHMFSETELLDDASQALANGKVIGWFQGPMEFGPRSLGNRSILASPREKHMKARVNKIKHRENFRPFAVSIRKPDVANFFEVPIETHVPFMNFCFVARSERRNEIAAVVHEDNTTRVQTVTENNKLFYGLLTCFDQKTGVPALLNTSFNIKGEPIVENPKQAIKTFLDSEIDLLYIGNFVVTK